MQIFEKVKNVKIVKEKSKLEVADWISTGSS
jgi:hypothetical protein